MLTIKLHRHNSLEQPSIFHSLIVQIEYERKRERGSCSKLVTSFSISYQHLQQYYICIIVGKTTFYVSTHQNLLFSVFYNDSMSSMVVQTALKVSILIPVILNCNLLYINGVLHARTETIWNNIKYFTDYLDFWSIQVWRLYYVYNRNNNKQLDLTRCLLPLTE